MAVRRTSKTDSTNAVRSAGGHVLPQQVGMKEACDYVTTGLPLGTSGFCDLSD